MEREKRNIGPHVAKVKFNIFVHKLMDDGSINPTVLDCKELFRDCQIAQQGELYIEGFDIWDCVNKVKKKLETLGDKS